MKIEDKEALGRQRAKPSRSKPDLIDQSVRTAHTVVQHYNGTQYCSTETFVNIPLHRKTLNPATPCAVSYYFEASYGNRKSRVATSCFRECM